MVHAAVEEGPQTIILHGKEAAVVLSAEKYHRLTRKRKKGGLVEFLLASPLAGADLEIERSKEPARDIEL